MALLISLDSVLCLIGSELRDLINVETWDITLPLPINSSPHLDAAR
jgi:hypothetical protein